MFIEICKVILFFGSFSFVLGYAHSLYIGQDVMVSGIWLFLWSLLSIYTFHTVRIVAEDIVDMIRGKFN